MVFALATCIHLIFVIDRIEPPYAVVEWAKTAEFSDIAQEHFPLEATEGSVWTIHLFADPDGNAASAPLDREIGLQLPPLKHEKQDLRYRFQLSKGSFQD